MLLWVIVRLLLCMAKNPGQWEGKTVSIPCPPKVLVRAILHGKRQQVQQMGRETATLSVGHFTSSSTIQGPNCLFTLNTEDEQDLEWRKKLMFLKNYSCWPCMAKKIWRRHRYLPTFQCCFWKQQHCSPWQSPCWLTCNSQGKWGTLFLSC